jgi:hypothetical protein
VAHKIVGSEDEVHKAVVRYLKLNGIDFKSDHEAGRKRNVWEQQRIKSMQSGRGWADLFLPYPNSKYSGMFLELKKDGARVYLKNGKLSTEKHIQEQASFLRRMAERGYYANFAIGADDAIKQINTYLSY